VVFETLYESALRGELILADGAMCHWHLRKDHQLTIRDIIVLPQSQNQHLGTRILSQLKKVPGATSIVARCPADLASNDWYKHMGFQLTGTRATRTGRRVNTWKLVISNET
jgi:N-acetylglutamate synthase-like GNAT family acetyltransferase